MSKYQILLTRTRVVSEYKLVTVVASNATWAESDAKNDVDHSWVLESNTEQDVTVQHIREMKI